MPSIDCPAAEVAQRIANIRGGRYLAVHIANTEPVREPLRVDVPVRIRIPPVEWLGYLVCALLFVALFSSLFGCGAPVSDPPPSRKPGSAAEAQRVNESIDVLGARLVTDAVMVSRWQDYRSTVNAIGRRP